MDANAGKTTVKILIVDDHYVTRHGLRRLLRTRPEFEVVAEAEDGAAAVARYREHEPDLVLMDLRMERMNGVDAINILRREYPDAKVLVFSSYERDDEIKAVCEAGIMGYVSKEADPEVLLQAIGQVAAGNTYMPGVLWQRMLTLLKQPALTPQERQLLRLVSLGLRADEIAAETNLTPGTVKVYISRLLSKLDASNRAEAVRIATARGLI